MGKFLNIAAWVMMGFAFHVLGKVMPLGHSGWPLGMMFIFGGWMIRAGTISGSLKLGIPAQSTSLRAVMGLHLFAVVAWTSGVAMRIFPSGVFSTPGLWNGALCLVIGLCFIAVMELMCRRRWLWIVLLGVYLVLGVIAIYAPQAVALPSHESTWVKMLLAALLVAYLLFWLFLGLTMVVIRKREVSGQDRTGD